MNYLEQSNVYLNILFQDKTIQLRQAVNQGDCELVNKLLTINNLDVNFSPDGHETILLTAIARNDAPMVRLLLKFKPILNPSSGSSSMYSPLWLAILRCYNDIAELLVRAGADVNERFSPVCSCTEYWGYGGRTSLLHLAVSRNDEAKVSLFLDHGADVNCRDNGQETALQCAVFREFISIAKLLLDRGASLDCVNVDGMTVLHTALLTGNVELVTLMLSRGANVMAIDKCGKNALHFLAESKIENVDIAEQLIKLGVLVNHSEFKCHLGPLHVALLTGKDGLVNLLLEHGADVCGKISGGFFPLCLGVIYCSNVVVSSLLKKGATVNEKTEMGETALHRACRMESVEKIQILLEFGANVNAKDEAGKTALFWIENKNCDAAKVLVKHLAKMKSKDVLIEEDELQIKQENPSLQIYYDKCLREIELMKQERFYYDYSLHNIFTENDKKLSLLVRNDEFVDGFKSISLATLFSEYGNELEIKFEVAQARKNLLHSMEEYLDSVFCHILPEPVVKKIIDYLTPEELHMY